MAAQKLQQLSHTVQQARFMQFATFRGKLECQSEIEAASEFLVDLAETASEEKHTELIGYAETIRKGGTLLTGQVGMLEKASGVFATAMRGIQQELVDMTDGMYNETTLKSYSPTGKKGLAPHRDCNFGGDPALVGMVSLHGLRSSALWVVPQTLILPDSDDAFMRKADRTTCLEHFRGTLGSRRLQVTPFDVNAQTTGDITLIDERPEGGGEWEDTKLGTVAVWHSVYGHFGEESETGPEDNYVLSLIARSRDPRAHIPGREYPGTVE